MEVSYDLLRRTILSAISQTPYLLEVFVGLPLLACLALVIRRWWLQNPGPGMNEILSEEELITQLFSFVTNLRREYSKTSGKELKPAEAQTFRLLQFFSRGL